MMMIWITAGRAATGPETEAGPHGLILRYKAEQLRVKTGVIMAANGKAATSLETEAGPHGLILRYMSGAAAGENGCHYGVQR